MQESIDRFLSYTSLQKVLKLILPPNNRHFLSNHRVFRLFNDKRPAKIPNIFRRLIMLHGWTWCGLGLFFRLMNVAIYFLTFQCLAGSKKNILELLWVGIRFSQLAGHVAVKISCIRKMARDWKISSQEALRDYKSCERQHLITEDAIHRGTEGTPRPLWETPPSSEGPRGCNHQQHDHDWRTTSRRETVSWEESCWWVSLRGENLRCMPDWKRHREHVRLNSVNMNC